MILLLSGIFLAIIAFQDIPKYKNPYVFTGVVAAIGIVIGYFVCKKVKPVMQKCSQKNLDNSTIDIYIVMIVIGFLLFAVNKLNIMSAHQTNCNAYNVENRYRSESGFRRPEVNTLVVYIENKKETIVCKYNLWKEKRIGATINLCFYESFLGFNYIEINE